MRWAVEQARLTGATVEAVLCWTPARGPGPCRTDRRRPR
ncbi:hypothetical protein [Kitasatospora purpeofusca]